VRDGKSSDSQDYHQRIDIIEAAAEAPVLRTQLTQAERATLTATSFVPMGIGFGVSVGGIMGIAFVLMAARWGRKGDQ
jgi:pantoate kinase